ncbi:MAG: bifunctional phosphoglucose/phosphomannose isomerase [Candidatus Bathyarchaeia archaeon]
MPSTTCLDDLEVIRKIDKKDMLSSCIDAFKHYEEAALLAKKVILDFAKPQNIIVAGMGGSAVGGELLKDWAEDRIAVPIEVCRSYLLPAYANERTLVFVVSYSGETEESLSVFLDALKRGCMVVCITSGGSLKQYAKKLSVPHLVVPAGMAPRAALPYLFLPLLVFLEKLSMVSGVTLEIAEAVKVLKVVSSENSPKKPLNGNFSKTLASAVNGTVPVVYGFGCYRGVAQRFKTQFNENSKVPAKWEFFSELNHNEIVGWEYMGKMAKHFSLIFIRDAEEPPEIRTRIEFTEKLLHEKHLRIFEVQSMGKNRLSRMCSTISIGDFTSVYLAVLRGVDPTPVKTISLLKDRLLESGLKNKVLRELQSLS